jgi:CO/xanthine dehydrogenase Mo-binding subunit
MARPHRPAVRAVPGVEFDDETYRGDAYPAFGWAACVASVDVDLDSGEVTVRDVVAADDVGHVIHPVLAEGQVEGGTLQAIGYATVEEIKLADGRYLNDRLATYIIPTALDAPRITVDPRRGAVQRRSALAKGVGELPMDVGAPAVVAAIHDATGVWIHDLPRRRSGFLAAMGATGDVTGPAGFGGGGRCERGGDDRRADPRREPIPRRTRRPTPAARGPAPRRPPVDDGWHDA